MPKITSELFSIPLGEHKYLVYAPLRRAAFVGNSSVVNSLADISERREIDTPLDEPLVNFLKGIEILDADHPETTPDDEASGEFCPTVVTLFLTTACNLRCTYCYAQAGDTPKKFMNLETARKGIDYVVKNALRMDAGEFGVGFHGGGEPSVNWKVLKGATEYARELAQEHGLGLHLTMATNGFLSDDQLTWLTANIGSVSLSIDGKPSTHDLHRPTATGKPSSPKVLNTIERLEEAGVQYGLRLTVTKDQIEALPSSIEYLCRRFSPGRIQVEPAYNMGRWKDAPSAETAAFIDAYRESQQIAQTYGQDLTFSGARAGTLTNHFCGVSNDNFTLSTDGSVSACFEAFEPDDPHKDVFFYGEASDQGFQLDHSKIDRLRNKTVNNNPYCSGCFAKWSCAGDCHYKALEDQRDGGSWSGSDRCHIIRELTKDQILEKIASAGGGFWHEGTDKQLELT